MFCGRYAKRSSFEIGNLCTSKAPEFFRKNNNQFPSSAADTPFQLAFNTPLVYFEWLGQNPELAKDFQQWMTLNQKATSSWVDWFNVQDHIMDGFNAVESAENVFFVDVGGGEGSFVRQFREKFPDVSGRLVLQDLPHVVSSIDKNTLPGVELAAHDFFTPQPIKGRLKFHGILKESSNQNKKITQELAYTLCIGFFMTGLTNAAAPFYPILWLPWNLDTLG